MKSDSTPKQENTKRQFVIVMRGPSAVFFHADDKLVVREFPSARGPVNMVYRTRMLDRGGVDIPGHLWIDIRGHASSLDEALTPFANAGLGLLPIMSLSANAAIGEPEVEIGYENTLGITEREYFQSYVSPERDVLYVGRRIKVEATVALLKALDTHPERERLLRGANQYGLALETWRLGRESLSLAHLWMALEAITKAKLRVVCAARSVTEAKLADDLGVDRTELDGTIRKAFLLKGDEECYKKGKEASDGFEHGFTRYDKIREHSKEIRHRMAHYVRTAILELCGIEEEIFRLLTSDPFDQPLGHWPVVKYLRGKLLGEGDELAAKGNSYPFVRWKPGIKPTKMEESGKLHITFEETFTPEVADGIKFQPLSYELWQSGSRIYTFGGSQKIGCDGGAGGARVPAGLTRAVKTSLLLFVS